MTTFNALVLNQDADKNQTATFQSLTLDDLPEGDVLVKIDYSSLNYKDGLAVTGQAKIARFYPMIPGIDFVGTVIESDTDTFAVGDSVILTGWGVGEKHWGGFAQYARVNSNWLVPLPQQMTAQHAMVVGTAGLTAMLSIMALEHNGVNPDTGDILVTGASGGAGSMAIALLSTLGYTVVASTGREELSDYLKSLGASKVIGRLATPERPMQSTRWAGAIDSVGGDTLAHVLASTHYGGSVAAFGLAGGSHLNTTVLPFILRGVNLLGIDSVMCPLLRRNDAWARIAAILSADMMEKMMQVEPLAHVLKLSASILAGQVRGRVVIDVNA